MPFTREGYVSPDDAPSRAPGCTCSDPQLELVGCDCSIAWDAYWESQDDPALTEMELAADRGPVAYDPEAQADLELHDALHPFGYGRDAPEPAAFVIVDELAGQWAGFSFPKRVVTERPDAREWPTRQEAVNALAAWRASNTVPRGTLDNFEVVEG